MVRWSNSELDRLTPAQALMSLREPDAVLERAMLLDRSDRLLVEMFLRGKYTHGEIARLLDVPKWKVTRRLQRLSARLHDPLVLALMNDACGLEPQTRQMGVEHFLLGRSASALARKYDLPLAKVRDVLTFLRGWHRAVATVGRARTWII